MEAVKRLPMISFELKNSPEATSFNNLKQCIAEYYHEDPESYSKEFRELEQLRGLACRPRVDFECVATIKRYYSQLHSLQNRFPLTSENELLDFAWKDIYSGSLWHTSNLKTEMASIFYNIAALHSQLGIEEDRNDPESMKIACTHFQCAAWVFGEIKNRYPQALKGDLTPELMIFMQQISFAQAQECILEKSLADNRKPAIIAKVTAQVISFYNAGMSALFSQNDEGSMQDLVGNKLYKEWLRYIKFKTSYLSSILFLYQGMNSEEQRKMGERVALYNAACEKLEEAKKESKGMNKIEVINEALIFVTDIVEGKRKNAKQENEFIYHEAIPEISSISAVQGANLVQGIPFEVTDPQVIGDDVFKRLVPMKTHEHLSVYSEEKANILRRLGAKIDERDAELASFMGSLNIEVLNSMGQAQDQKLPEGVVDRCAELSAKPNAIPDLIESMSNLADICCDVEMSLKEIKKFLDEEAKQEENYQKQIGKRPTGHMAELNREYTKYFEAHTKAGDSNDTLRKAMELHVSNLKILAQPLLSLKNQVPQANAIDEVTRKELTILLNKVEEMKGQRDEIFNDLRDQILNKDDITPQLITHGDKDVEELFKKELKKYSQTVSIIEQNLVAQGNILKALTDTYAKHAMTLKSYNDAKAKREQFYSSLIASFDVYEDLMAKSAKGLDFYKKLHGNVQKLMSRVKAARDVQEEERQQILKKATPKAPPVDSMKNIDSSYKNMITSMVPPSSGTGGPKLKDYLKSGMVPGMGGLRDDLNKLPVRPSPVGQENIPNSNPATCPSMNYPVNYRNQPTDSNYPYYPNADQHSLHSGSGSLSSSSTSLNNDSYNQNNAGYVNPIYQTGHEAAQNHQKPDYPPSYQQSQYGNYGAMYGQQQQQQQVPPATQQYDYFKNQQNYAAQSLNYNQQYSSLQDQKYPVAQSPNPQQYPVAQSPAPMASQQPPVANTMYSGYNQPQYPGTTLAATQNQFPATSQYSVAQQQYQQPAQNHQYQSLNPASPQVPYSQNNSTGYNQQFQSPPAAQGSTQQYQNLQGTQQFQSPQNLQTQNVQNLQPQNPQNVQPQNLQQQNSAQFQTTNQYQNVPTATPIPNASPIPQVPNPSTAQQFTPNNQQFQQPQAVQPTPPVQQINNMSLNQNQQYPNSTPSQQFQTQSDQNQQPADQPYSAANPGSNFVQSQDFNSSQQNYYNYNNNMTYGDQYSQQNYSCYTPTMNSMSSYMTSGSDLTSQTTQSENYYQYPETNVSAVPPAVAQQPQIPESPSRQPTAIPTYSPAVNSAPVCSNSTVPVQSQQQISSPVENVPKPIKSENMDLLSGIDFSISSDIPTLTPVAVLKPLEAAPKIEILVPQSPAKAPAEVKLNDDLADLDFNSLSPKTQGSPVKKVEPEKPKKLEDPFEDSTTLKQFHKEVESLEKFMETLTVKTLNGVTPLANKWKELQDLLVKDEGKRSVSVAKLFPDKNRSTDCLPYDHARVQLPTATDDYINAVFVKDCGSVSFILTQTPMANTVNDYWEMVWAQKSNTLVCLHSASELLDPFWPQNVNEEKNYGEVSVVLVKQFDFSHCNEKIFKVSKHGSDATTEISLLQVKSWKKSSAEQILDIAGNILTSFKQHNSDEKQVNPPIILNCISGGAERSGLMTVGISAIGASQLRKPTLLNVVDHWFRICSQRKGALEDEQLIQMSLNIVLNNAHRILNKRGIMTSYQMKNAEKLSAAAETEKSVKDTGLDSLDPFWKFK